MRIGRGRLWAATAFGALWLALKVNAFLYEGGGWWQLAVAPIGPLQAGMLWTAYLRRRRSAPDAR